MGSLASRANDQVLQYLFTANRAFNIPDDASLVIVDKLQPFGIKEHQLVEQLQAEPNEIFEILLALDIAWLGDKQLPLSNLDR